MAVASQGWHEDADALSRETKELHRGIVSLIEELEAVDWYQQRVDATSDPELREVLAHNLEEEVEHACMTLEWIRRRHEAFDRELRRILFREGSIVASGDGPARVRDEDASLRLGRLPLGSG